MAVLPSPKINARDNDLLLNVAEICLFSIVCDMRGTSFQNNNDFNIHKRAHLQQMGRYYCEEKI